MTIETTTTVMTEDEARRITERIREAARALSSAAALAPRPKRARASADHLYLMQIGDEGPVKIGRATDIAARRATLATASPWPIRVVAVIPSAGGREREIHDRFACFRMNGEWFEPIPEIFDWFAMEAI